MVLSVLVRGVLAIGAALLGVVLWAGHARADVAVSPDQAIRGDAADLTLRLTEDRPGAYTTRVEVRFPASSPVAEVYPMSVDGWGPQIVTQHVGEPLPGVHQASVTDVVSAITWIRAEPPAEPGPIELVISLGPLPQGERLTMPIVQTYSDGTVVTWADAPGGAHPAASLALVPGTPAAAVGHAGHGGHGTGTGADAAAGSADRPQRPDSPVSPLGVTGQLGVALVGGVVAGGAVGVGYLLLTRRRRDGAGPSGAPAAVPAGPAPGPAAGPGAGPAGGADQDPTGSPGASEDGRPASSGASAAGRTAESGDGRPTVSAGSWRLRD
ncbi:DUF1775 domain-containing protein [Plantactinospora sp. KBS50]|uniref:DUF1775 domain-containing protein n=1 Tax=Plantactinospora sp. KBS50 TaxID=2024580 RepID=UPI0018DFC9D1|nr:DUF1775 domain-containing protein [Plantactinospora sp. KBS50]